MVGGPMQYTIFSHPVTQSVPIRSAFLVCNKTKTSNIIFNIGKFMNIDLYSFLHLFSCVQIYSILVLWSESFWRPNSGNHCLRMTSWLIAKTVMTSSTWILCGVSLFRSMLTFLFHTWNILQVYVILVYNVMLKILLEWLAAVFIYNFAT